jgi:hypothetical protein
MLALSAELLRRVRWHTRPRHLWKLIASCKYLKEVLDTNEYWLKFAIFMHARYTIR